MTSPVETRRLSAFLSRGPILLLLALAGLGWAFAKLADEVLESETPGIDAAILLSMRNPADLSDPIGPAWVEIMGRDLTALGGSAVLTLFVVSATGFLWLRGERRSVLLLLGAVALGTAISKALKSGFDRPRPDLVPHDVLVTNASFPSGHSLMAAAVYLTLGVLVARATSNRRVRVFVVSMAVLTTMLVGISRVYLGVHWPTDVLAGWTLGAAVALICGALARP